ncbi:MAG TPA: glycerophosphodiester phosphodiesterase, partial [Pseudomonadales bacterium]|nr:glycerophosphodiester phosphodiesterase [Pseudomonadales bacterium]
VKKLVEFGWPVLPSRPLVIGHRGARAHAPENTLASFRKASELGADMWELDVWLTGDGHCVVSHDENLFRVAGLDRAISTMEVADITALDAGIPTFGQVVDLAVELGAGLYVELKGEGTGEYVWRLLTAREFRYAAIGSFHAPWIRALRDAGCPYPLSVLVRAHGDPFAMAERSGADMIHLCWENAAPSPQELVTGELLRRAVEQGLHIVLWHEERPDVLADLVEMPVLGICSDTPERVYPDRTSAM